MPNDTPSGLSEGERRGATCQHARDKLPYLAASEDAETRIKRGERQRQCPTCKLWLWPHEMGGTT